jgi:hypothetical protein
MGRNGGRQWGDSAAAYGELSMAAVNPIGNSEQRLEKSSPLPLDGLR